MYTFTLLNIRSLILTSMVVFRFLMVVGSLGYLALEWLWFRRGSNRESRLSILGRDPDYDHECLYEVVVVGTLTRECFVENGYGVSKGYARPSGARLNTTTININISRVKIRSERAWGWVRIDNLWGSSGADSDSPILFYRAFSISRPSC